MVAPMIATFGMTDTVKSLDLDYVSLSFGVPRYKNGYALSLKIPGLTKLLAQILDAPPQPAPAK